MNSHLSTNNGPQRATCSQDRALLTLLIQRTLLITSQTNTPVPFTFPQPPGGAVIADHHIQLFQYTHFDFHTKLYDSVISFLENFVSTVLQIDASCLGFVTSHSFPIEFEISKENSRNLSSIVASTTKQCFISTQNNQLKSIRDFDFQLLVQFREQI